MYIPFLRASSPMPSPHLPVFFQVPLSISFFLGLSIPLFLFLVKQFVSPWISPYMCSFKKSSLQYSSP